MSEATSPESVTIGFVSKWLPLASLAGSQAISCRGPIQASHSGRIPGAFGSRGSSLATITARLARDRAPRRARESSTAARCNLVTPGHVNL